MRGGRGLTEDAPGKVHLLLAEAVLTRHHMYGQSRSLVTPDTQKTLSNDGHCCVQSLTLHVIDTDVYFFHKQLECP